MSCGQSGRPEQAVALLAEGVDRNGMLRPQTQENFVALLAEGVDRNFASIDHRKLKRKVALLAEGVDRNTHGRPPAEPAQGRPPRGGRG